MTLAKVASSVQKRYAFSVLSNSVAGRTAIITGGSRGIGAAIASRFAQEGVTCVLVGRTESTLSATVQSLPGSGHQYVSGNVADHQFWDSLKHKCDILVNAAGTTHVSLLSRTAPETIEEVIQTNLMGTIYASRAVLKGMQRKRAGCIINISSLLGLQGGRGSSVYAASKAGIIGFTRALAAEAGPLGVRVNAIVPGYIDTDMTKYMDEPVLKKLEANIPSQRFGTPDEIADAAYFLATNQYANNCVLNLDGGLSAK